MIEFLINPKRAERKPWEMFFIGFFYGIVAIVVPYYLIFRGDPINSGYLSWITILFLVILTTPFFYYIIKLEEKKDEKTGDERKLLKEHGKAIMCFLWLFLGFLLAFTLLYMLIPNSQILYKAQIGTFCQINPQPSFSECLNMYGVQNTEIITGAVSSSKLYRFFEILKNNINVLIFTLVLSLIFGAGAIFILAWNASVIAAAIVIFAKSNIAQLPSGFLRYMIHGLPEIAAYFVAALAGGILSIAIIRREFQKERFWNIMKDSLNLLLIAIIILLVSALIEVFITPCLFGNNISGAIKCIFRL